MKNSLPSTIEEIKEAGKEINKQEQDKIGRNYTPLFIWINNKEAVIFPAEYTKTQWHKLTWNDVKRNCVY